MAGVDVVFLHNKAKADVKARIGKARVAFLQLKNVWKSNIALSGAQKLAYGFLVSVGSVDL